MDPLEQRYVDLIDRNGPRIRRLCRSWARRGNEGDLEAEVFLQLWRALPSFEGRSNIDTWAYRVTLNVVLSQTRKERLRQGTESDTEVELLPGRPAADSLEASERRSALHAALAELEDADRTLLSLWLEELPYAQIAEITGLTTTHVGVRIHRLKKRLTDRLRATAEGA
ncbi:MAG: sigma-70 family RNA polymerase sigma factor [Acidobacteriota bacterium]